MKAVQVYLSIEKIEGLEQFQNIREDPRGLNSAQVLQERVMLYLCSSYEGHYMFNDARNLPWTKLSGVCRETVKCL